MAPPRPKGATVLLPVAFLLLLWQLSLLTLPPSVQGADALSGPSAGHEEAERLEDTPSDHVEHRKLMFRGVRLGSGLGIGRGMRRIPATVKQKAAGKGGAARAPGAPLVAGPGVAKRASTTSAARRFSGGALKVNKRGKAVAESIQGPRNSLLPFVAGAHMGSNWWRNSNSNSNSKAPAQATEQHLQAEEHRRGWRPDSRADKPLRRPAVVDAREMSNASKGQSDKRLKDMTEDVLSRVAGTKGQQPVA